MHVAQGVDNTTESDYWEVDLGEVKIILEREMDGPISLTIFDGQQYGTVVKDDELLIDVDRKVTINGEERKPIPSSTPANSISRSPGTHTTALMGWQTDVFWSRVAKRNSRPGRSVI